MAKQKLEIWFMSTLVSVGLAFGCGCAEKNSDDAPPDNGGDSDSDSTREGDGDGDALGFHDIDGEVAVADFIGDYRGEYVGDEYGSFEFTVSADGLVSGRVWSNDDVFEGEGTLAEDGDTEVVLAGQERTVVYTGRFRMTSQGPYVFGNWSEVDLDMTGQWGGWREDNPNPADMASVYSACEAMITHCSEAFGDDTVMDDCIEVSACVVKFVASASAACLAVYLDEWVEDIAAIESPADCPDFSNMTPPAAWTGNSCPDMPACEPI